MNVINAWRLVLMTCVSCMLCACLVVVPEPLPSNQPAPIPLLGDWQREDEWGDNQFLSIERAGANLYRAHLSGEQEQARSYGFSVAQHGRRWYASAGLPQSLGGQYAILGFELTRSGELVIYTLDVERIEREIERGHLQGQVLQTDEADVIVISSEQDAVLSYLENRANADVFVEVARYQRSSY